MSGHTICYPPPHLQLRHWSEVYFICTRNFWNWTTPGTVCILNIIQKMDNIQRNKDVYNASTIVTKQLAKY